VVATTGADVIFFPHSPLNVQIAARLASRVGAILATDCIAVSIADGELRGAVRPVYGSKVLATFAGGYPMVLTVRSGRHVSQPRAPKKSPPAVREVGLAGRAVRARLLERRFLGGDEGANLHSARIVVGVGRGVGGPEGVALVREQARRIDAAVAASKAVVDAGWAPATWMVGQTGKKISPQLYIAVGISGAIQHMAGVSGARSVVAINTDADAPIMGNSDLGLVGDWREVLPRFISALASVL
jgi:electron transfer flavoprotein alpha subunit